MIKPKKYRSCSGKKKCLINKNGGFYMKLITKLKKMNPYASLASDGLLSDIEYYIDTGSYALNALLSGSIFKGFPGNRIVGFAGPPTAGKTYLTLAILKNYLVMNNDYYVIYYDTEGRLTRQQLVDAGLITERFIHNPIRNLEEFKNQFIQTIDLIKKDRGIDDQKAKKDIGDITTESLLSDDPYAIKKLPPKKIEENYFYALDSLSMMGSLKEVKDALESKNASDMGLRARVVKSIFRNITMDLNILKQPMIVTSHVYDSMNQYLPSIIAGGQGLQYAAAIIVEFLPTKDSITDGKGTRNVIGTSVKAILRKSELTKQWKNVTIKVNFSKGLDRFSGLFNIALEGGIIKKDGKKFLFPDGNKWFQTEIDLTPEKCYTGEALKAIDEYTQTTFTYGKGDKELTDEENKKLTLEEIKKEFSSEASIKSISEILGQSDEKFPESDLELFEGKSEEHEE
jgi:RecA/RadA recombinase